MNLHLITSGVRRLARDGIPRGEALGTFSTFARTRGIGKRTNSVEGRSDQRDGARATEATLGAHYRFVVWLVPTVERSLRSQKILLGDRIQATAMDVLEQLVEST